jgi:metal-responsive CopG/Arc/MetJ family transcriptional regulator
MRKEQLVASRLPAELVRDLELIEQEEQTDRSTTVRKLLRRAIGDWKLAPGRPRKQASPFGR